MNIQLQHLQVLDGTLVTFQLNDHMTLAPSTPERQSALLQNLNSCLAPDQVKCDCVVWLNGDLHGPCCMIDRSPSCRLS